MKKLSGPDRDLASLVVPRVGRLEATGDAWDPYRLVDASCSVVEAVSVYLKDLLAAGKSASTIRSYGHDLLRWWRFLAAVDVSWDRATRIEARDFARWLQLVPKPRRGGGSPARAAGNPITGKPTLAAKYEASTRAHCETVLRGFYDFHLESSAGPLINPFPLARLHGGRSNAHHNPMEPFRNERSGRYRPTVAKRIPRSIPDDQFNEIFAALRSHRDRALVAFWVSTGARASELLGARVRDADPGQQLISVVRKGTQAVQQLPASPDAFVWLRLCQAEMRGRVPAGRAQPLWWTLRRPARPLTYHAAHRMFERVNAGLGADWTLHDLRHTAAYRMSRDPRLPLVDVQWVLGHASLTTTQIYLTPTDNEVIQNVLAHHARTKAARAERTAPPPAPGYRPEHLDLLFGRGSR